MEQKEEMDFGTIMKREFDRVHERFDALDQKIDFKVNELRQEMKHESMSIRRGFDYHADRIENHEQRVRILEGDEDRTPL